MLGNLFKKRNQNIKVQTAEEYWHERNNRNKQKAAFLGIDYNKYIRQLKKLYKL